MKTENENIEYKSERRRGRRGGKSAQVSRGGRGRGPRGGARRKRPLAHGDLRLLILSIIAGSPSHGYGLIAQIKDKTSGAYAPSPGVIYPAIETLQDLEWVEIQPENGKRILHITAAGKAELEQQVETVKSIETRLAKLASAGTELSEPNDVRGALQQLRHATVTAIKGAPDDTDIRKAAADILHDARKKIQALV